MNIPLKLALSGCLMLSAIPAQADLVRPKAKPNVGTNAVKAAETRLPIIVVQALRNGGGLVDTGADTTEALNLRFTRSLQKYLSESARDRYVVAAGDSNITDNRFLLEGDLSHVADKSPEGGPYLCSLRLFREDDGQRRLIGQWAGWAASLRYLTVNLRHHPKIDAQGLTGELGKRVAQSLLQQRSSTTQSTLMSWLAAQEKRPPADWKVEVVKPPDADREETGVANDNAGALIAGTNFYFQVTTPAAGELWLLEQAADAPLQLLRAGEKAAFARIDAKAPVLLPVIPIVTSSNADGAPSERKFWVLWRRATMQQPSLGLAMSGNSNAQDTLPVRVVGEAISGASGDELDAVAERVTQEPSSWSARAVMVRLVPTRADGN
jgi:hypothetical protein